MLTLAAVAAAVAVNSISCEQYHFAHWEVCVDTHSVLPVTTTLRDYN
jgi:hypothetical protein